MKTFPYTAPIFAKLLLDQADRIQVERESSTSVGEGEFWTLSVNRYLEQLTTHLGSVRAIYTHDGAHEFLLDLVWWQDSLPQGALLACEMEWGNTRDRENNPTRVAEDFDKLLNFKAPFKLMIFDSYGDASLQRNTLDLLERYLREFEDHRKGEEYLLLDFSPRREAYYCPIQQDGPDSMLHFFPLDLRSDIPPVTGYVDTAISVLDGSAGLSIVDSPNRGVWMAHLFGSLSVLTILAVVFVPYWIPTIVAFVRHVDRKAGIVLLNVFAGWTVIGWVAALIWAFVAETEKQARLREAAYASMAGMQHSSNVSRL